MSKFRMYIDETGNSDLKRVDGPNQRFLSLTGVIIDVEHVQSNVYPEMERLKSRYFGSHPDDPAIFHRKELVNRAPPFENLQDPLIEREFSLDLLGCLRDWEYAVVTACLDKKNYMATYGALERDPYNYCMTILMERFVEWTRIRNAAGDVMAESRGRREDKRLKAAFADLRRHGTTRMAPDAFQSSLTSKDIKIKTKAANVSGLQIADMLAHPSRNEILNENGLFERTPSRFAEQIIAILKTKYGRDETGAYMKEFL